MRAAINFVLLVFLVMVMGMVYYSCENTTGADPTYLGKIQGWVYEDSTKLPLSGVKVWADGIPDTLYTNDSGRFHYTRIVMPRGEFNYFLIFQKSGYIDKSMMVYVKSDLESKVDSVFMKKTF